MDQPSPHLIRAVNVIDKFTDTTGTWVAWLNVPLVLAVAWEVASRYLFDAPTIWSFDVTYMLYGTIFMLGAAFALHKGAHIRTDFFFEKWSVRTRGTIDSVAYLVFFFPSCLMVVYTSWPFVRNSWSVWESSPDPGGIPARWALKSVIIIGFVILMIQGLSELIKRFYVARGWEQPASRVKEIH